MAKLKIDAFIDPILNYTYTNPAHACKIFICFGRVSTG